MDTKTRSLTVKELDSKSGKDEDEMEVEVVATVKDESELDKTLTEREIDELSVDSGEFLDPQDEYVSKYKSKLRTMFNKYKKTIGGNNVRKMEEFVDCIAQTVDYFRDKCKILQGKLSEREEIINILKEYAPENIRGGDETKEILASLREISKTCNQSLEDRKELFKIVKSIQEVSSPTGDPSKEGYYDEFIKKKDKKIRELEEKLTEVDDVYELAKESWDSNHLEKLEKAYMENNKLKEEKIKELEKRLEEKEIIESVKVTTSYADIVRKDKGEKVAKEDHGGVLIVYPTKEDISQEDLKSEIKKSINPNSLGIGVTGIKRIRNKGLAFECEKKKDVDILRKEIEKHESLKSLLRINKQSKRLPRIIVYDIPIDCDESAITESMFRRFKKLDKKENVIKWKFKIKSKSGCFHHVFEVDSEAYKCMVKEKIYMAWTVHKIANFVFVPRCYLCYRFGHFQKVCKLKEQICSNCTEKHSYRDCKSDIRKCVNCLDYNVKFHTSIDFNHSSMSNACPSYKRQEKLLSERTDYGTM